ncbi:hypothetical protein ACFV1L_04195 [Kitasatospora sp. NPDC059646]|uniref:hypothetical protein n=1 Tax=Kitasatospora sp. NPDC059646 TaxID=3346893 RepID=UPI0036A1FBC3
MRTSPRAHARVALAAGAGLTLALLVPGAAGAATGTPNVPTDLYNAYQPCATDPNAPLVVAGRGSGVTVEGIPSHTSPSAYYLTEQFRYWPVADPTQIATVERTWSTPGYEATAELPGLVDGSTYAWQARTVDPSNGAASDWTASCYVLADDTFPSQAPTVVSPNYPEDQASQGGAPIHLELGSNGVSDIVGFQYSWDGVFSVSGADIGEHGIPHYNDPFADPKWAVRADTLGGTASVDLMPRSPSWIQDLYVRSVDRAMNPSPTYHYRIRIKADAPKITALSNAPYGKPVTFKFTPDPGVQAASPVVSYSITRFGSQDPVVLPAESSGVATTTLALAPGETMMVSSLSANGWTSQRNWWRDETDSTTTVTSAQFPANTSSAAVPGTFHFAPKTEASQIASYTYAFGWSDQPTTVPAGKHGELDVAWTPPYSGWYYLVVHATTKDGVQLADTYYWFGVN